MKKFLSPSVSVEYHKCSKNGKIVLKIFYITSQNWRFLPDSRAPLCDIPLQELMMFEMEDTFSLSPLLRQDLSGSADLHQHHNLQGVQYGLTPMLKRNAYYCEKL